MGLGLGLGLRGLGLGLGSPQTAESGLASERESPMRWLAVGGGINKQACPPAKLIDRSYLIFYLRN